MVRAVYQLHLWWRPGLGIIKYLNIPVKDMRSEVLGTFKPFTLSAFSATFSVDARLRRGRTCTRRKRCSRKGTPGVRKSARGNPASWEQQGEHRATGHSLTFWAWRMWTTTQTSENGASDSWTRHDSGSAELQVCFYRCFTPHNVSQGMNIPYNTIQYNRRTSIAPLSLALPSSEELKPKSFIQ